jgi:hypothetical protein
MTWHDLRATGATWMAVRGDTPFAIKHVLGHKSVATTEIYIREADAIREGFGDVFPALPASLVDPLRNLARIMPVAKLPLPILAENKRSRAGWTGLEPAGQKRTRGGEFGWIVDIAGGCRIRNDANGTRFASFRAHFANPNPKLTEAALERAIVDALRRGLGDVAKTLAESLDARRRRRERRRPRVQASEVTTRALDDRSKGLNELSICCCYGGVDVSATSRSFSPRDAYHSHRLRPSMRRT